MLEVLLSLVLVSGILLAAQTSLLNLWYQAGRWPVVNAMINVQWQAHQSIKFLHQQVCGQGLQAAHAQAWRLLLKSDKGCELYDIRYDAKQGRWQKRRTGGRYTTFLSDVPLQTLHYGLAPPSECYVSQWRTEVTSDQLAQVVMLKLQLHTGIRAQVTSENLPTHWQYAAPDYAASHSDELWLWQPLMMVIALPCKPAITNLKQ